MFDWKRKREPCVKTATGALPLGQIHQFANATKVLKVELVFDSLVSLVAKSSFRAKKLSDIVFHAYVNADANAEITRWWCRYLQGCSVGFCLNAKFQAIK